MGNQVWPISCAVIQNRLLALVLDAVEEQRRDIPCRREARRRLTAAGQG